MATIGLGKDLTANINLFDHPVCLTHPLRLTTSAWIAHIPFAFYLVDILRPGKIIELGTHSGVSYCAFCQAVRELGLETRCYAVDTWEGDSHAGFYGPEVLKDLREHHDPLYGGFSRLVESTFDEALNYFPDETFDLLHIDGFHSYEAVKQDFEKWLPKMTDRGIVLFHDINVRERDFGVWRFWDELKAVYPHFEFVHSHGLGVLAVGKNYPMELRQLFDSTQKATAGIRELFYQLGSRLDAACELQTLRQTVKEVSALAEEKATLVHERNLELTAQATRLQEKNGELQESQRSIHEKNLQLITQSELIRSKDEQINQIDRDRQERDRLIHEKNLQLMALGEELKNRDEQIHEKNLQLMALGEQVKSGAEQILEKDLKVQAISRELQQRDTELHKKDQQLTFHSELIQQKDCQLQNYLQLLSEGERLQESQNEKLCEVDQRLQLKERQLQLKIKQLHEKELHEQKKNHELLTASEQLRNKDSQIRDKDWQLTGLKLQLEEKEKVIQGFIKSVDDFGRSGSYRLGRALSWPLRMVKQQIKGTTNGYQQDEITPENRERALERFFSSEPNVKAKPYPSDGNAAHDYKLWTELYDTLTDQDREAILGRVAGMGYKPLISVVMPVYNVEERWLRAAIESVRKQLYPYWELCIADDNSTEPYIRILLEEYARTDSRIKVAYRKQNGHISAASNSALELVSGEFLALLDHDDELPEHALYMVANELNKWPNSDLIYSDEDKINENGERFQPHFKSDWNPDLFYSCNTISHLGVYRTSIVKKIGGFREGYEGSQDYDLALRFTEQISEYHIRHVPHVLYHWRAISGSVALASGEKNYAHEAARKAISSHFERKGIKAAVTEGHNCFHRVIYPVSDPAPLVSLIIATRDRVELLSQTVEGLLNETDYAPIEVIIVDNESKDPATLEYLQAIQKDQRVKVTEYSNVFNYSAINNLGFRKSSGELIGLINNDIKVISPGWLREMVSHAVRPEIGAVGAKLLYPDDTVQHAGVILGINGVAAHAHRQIPKDSPGYMNRAMIIQALSAVTGACMILRREVFEKVGGMDEVNLPVAFNDVDFCIRVVEKGYRIVWTPYAELYHLESASRGRDDTPENITRFGKEVEYMRSVWYDKLVADPYYNPNLTMVSEDFSLAVPPRIAKEW